MPHYAYRAVDAIGAQHSGFADAAHEQELFQALRLQGLNLISCSSRRNEQRAATGGSKLLLSDQAVLCRHILAMLEAGIPLQVALEDILASHPGKTIVAELRKILRHVSSGTSLSTAFQKAGTRFDPLFTLLLRAGEKTGRLKDALLHLQESLDWKDTFQKKLRKTLSYPALQLVLASFAVTVLTTVAIPQISQLLEVIGNGMPLYARILLAMMNFLGGFFMLLLVGVVLLLIMLPLLRSLGERWRVMIDRMALRLPLLGPVLLKSALTQLMHVFSGMLASGITMMEALQMLPELTPNRALAQELDAVRQQVEGGRTLTHAFQKGMQLPAYVVRLLKVGEDGGDIRQSLMHIATLYQKESQQAADALLKGSSVIITLGVGLVLAGMVLGVMYPLYNGLSVMVSN